jgi:hypothetical protein
MAISDLELNHDEDYRNLIKAVIETAIVDYTKLQHPLNRNKKYLNEGFLSAVEMFFDENYKFEAFTSIQSESPLTTKDMLSIMVNSTEVNMEKTKQYVIDESINYWWTKNFHDIKIPSKIIIYGKTWFIHNAQKQYIDYEKQHLYIPLKTNKADRIYFDLILQIILKEANIDLLPEDFQTLHKVFYLFLKVNNAFSTK